MRDWSFALSTGCLGQLKFIDCLPLVRDHGFTSVEVCSLRSHLDYLDDHEVERAAQSLRELHVEARSFHAPFGPHLDITTPEDQLRLQAFHELQAAARAAARLGCKYFVLHPGPERSDIPASERPDRMRNAARVLNLLAVECREAGLRLVLETMLPHLFAGAPADLLWLLGSITVREVELCLDTGHGFLGGDLGCLAHKLRGHVSVLHAHDNMGRFDDHLPPGKGRIDWPPLMGQLARQGFQGTIVLELANCSGHPVQGLTAAHESMNYLRALDGSVAW